MRPRPSPERPETTPGHVPRLGGRLLLIALLVFPPHLMAATITVSGTCTLPDAVNAANTDAPAGGCPAGSGPDTVELTADVTLTAADNYAHGDNGLPVVTSDVTVQGNGFTVERAGGSPEFRLFMVAASGTLTLESVTVTGGGVLDQYEPGGGLLVYGGSASLTNSTISGNSANAGGGIAVVSSFYGSSASLVLSNTTVSGNSSYYAGGGIEVRGNYGYAASVDMTNTTVSGNSSSYVGGGIRAFRYTSLAMTNSTVSGNSSGYSGGGLSLSGASATLTDSQVVDNTASNYDGGGISADGGRRRGSAAPLTSPALNLIRSTLSGNSAAYGSGGAIHVGSGVPTTLTNSTVSGNMAQRDGGGLSLFYAEPTTITNSTFSGNYAVGRRGGDPHSSITAYYSSDVTVSGSVFGNALAYGGTGFHCNSVTIVDLGGNLADDSSCGTIPATLTGLDPVLADNGGPTLTHALAETSTAVDAAGACGLATDQRGVARDDGSCDSGAFELEAPPTPVELIELLIEAVESLALPAGLENALLSKLENARASLAGGNVGATINKLNAFINQVGAQSGKKIPSADAAELIAAAEAIIDLLSG